MKGFGIPTCGQPEKGQILSALVYDFAGKSRAAERPRSRESSLGRTPVNHKLTLAIGTAAALLIGCASTPEPAPQPQPQSLPGPIPPQPRAPAPVAAPAPAPAAPKRCDASVTFQSDETFAFNRYTLTDAAKARLDQDVVGKLATCASVEAVVVEGHADRIGSQQYNQKLSERRADAVRAYLVEKGADRAKIETIGMGKTVPAKFCPDIKKRADLIACLAPNRRAITSFKGPAK
jgi:OOP family OmpA-OmpF porin